MMTDSELYAHLLVRKTKVFNRTRIPLPEELKASSVGTALDVEIAVQGTTTSYTFVKATSAIWALREQG